jgi:general secretion pathway protein J
MSITGICPMPGTRPGAARRSDGFTLVEVLVVMIIMALLMGVVFGSLRLSERSLQTGRERADRSEIERSVGDFLRRLFAQLTVVPVGPTAGEQFALMADGERLRFVAPAPAQSAGVGLFVYELKGVSRAGQLDLEISYAMLDPGADEVAPTAMLGSRVLVSNLETLAFRFFGLRTEHESEPEWHDTWREDWGGEVHGLPELIQVSIVPSVGDPWPDLVFRVRPETQS